MDCVTFCNASSYRIKPLYESLRTRYKATLFRDAIHVEMPLDGITRDIFYFSYGATVCWGLSKEAGLRILEEIRDFEHHHTDEVETDEFTYVYGDSPKIIEDEIILPNPDALTKHAISHGLAQSVKLGTFENAIQKTFNSTKHIPEDLAKRGRIPLSKHEIRRKMGELFLERNSVNLHADILDTPEFFWDYPELEYLYTMVANYLDLETRVEVLNQRLDVIHELFQVLGAELNHQHASRLEWTIIWLIVIEVVLTLMKDVFQIL